MRTLKSQFVRYSLGIICLSAFAACGGSSGGSQTGASGAASQDSTTVFRTIGSLNAAIAASFAVLSEDNSAARSSLSPSQFALTETVEELVACEQGGFLSISSIVFIPDEALADQGEEVSGPIPLTIDSTVGFRGCDGLFGDISLFIDAVFEEDSFDFLASINGSLAEGQDAAASCFFSFNNLTFLAVLRSGQEMPLGTISGSVGGRCGDEPFLCSWNNVNLNDEAALDAGCS